MAKALNLLFLSALFCVILSFSTCLKARSNQLLDIPSSNSNTSIQGQLTQILVEVQTTPSSENALKLLKSLNSIVADCGKLQLDHKRVHAKMASQCQTEINFRKEEIKNSGQTQRRALDARAKCNSSLKQAQKELPELQNTKTTYESELKSSEDFRIKENKRYASRKQEYEEAISYITKSSSAMSNNTNLNFVELSENLLKHSSKLGLLTEAVPVLVALAGQETSLNNTNYSQVNQNLKDKLKDTFAKLLVRLQKDWNDNEEMEQKSAQTFTVYKTKLTTLINSLEKSISICNQQIEAMTKCVQEEDAISSQAGIKLTMNSKILDNAQRMCDRFDKEFVEATKVRLQEITTSIQISTIVKTRFNVDVTNTMTMLTSVKASWEAYMETKEFKGMTGYMTRSTTKNVSVTSIGATKTSFL